MDIIEHPTTKKIVENFYLMKHFGQSWPVLGIYDDIFILCKNALLLCKVEYST